jgi:tetratricopeptide (TPR) repeat protein
MQTITGNQSLVDLLYILEILYEEKSNLSPAENVLSAYLHYHLFSDGKAISPFIDDANLEGLCEFKLTSSLPFKSVKELELMFSKRLISDTQWSGTEASLWMKIWLYLYSRPPFSSKILDHVDNRAFSLEELLFVQYLNKNLVEYESLILKGGIVESRLRHALFLGDIKNDWKGSIKLLSKNDAIETLIKIEFLARSKMEIGPFWATEQNLYSSLGEIEFKNATLFQHASSDNEELALEQLVNLADNPNWAKALAIKTGIKIAARNGEDVMLMKLYYKLYQAAKSDEIKGAACLRAAMIADHRLHRYREAEEFYRLALEYNIRPFIAKRGLFRMLLARKAYGEIIQLSNDSTDPLVKNAAAIISEIKLFDFKKALEITPHSDIYSRAHLFLKLGEWESLYDIYSSPQTPVPSSISKMVVAIIDAGNSKWEKAEKEITPILAVAPLLGNLLLTFWKNAQEDCSECIKIGNNVLDQLSSEITKRSLRLTLATWVSESNPIEAAKLIGDYIESGGSLPSSEEKGTRWFEVLMQHPNPNSQWFSEIEPELDKIIDATEDDKDWEKLAKLLKIKTLVVKHEQSKINYLIRLAKLYEEALQDIKEATYYFTKILNINATNKVALDALARINETNEDWDKYLQVIRLSMEANTDRVIKASLYFKYGSILETQYSKIEEALKYYKLAIDFSPTSLPALHGIRDIYVKKEHWKGVLNTLKMEASIWDDPKEKAGIYTQMGEILHEKLKKTEQAEIYFTAALKLRPDSSGALRALFKLHYRDKNWEKASEVAGNLTKRAISVGTSEERAQFFFERGYVFSQTGDLQEAAISYISSIRLDNNNLEPLEALLKTSSGYHDPKEFVSFLSELEEIFEGDEHPKASSMLAIARAKLNQANKNSINALKLFKHAGEVSPHLLEAALGEATILLLMGRDDECYKRWQSYYEFCKNSGESYSGSIEMAKFYSLKLDRSRESMTVLRSILQKNPNDHNSLYELASELFANGQNKEAMVTIDRLLTLTKRESFEKRADYVMFALLFRFESGERRKAETILNSIDISLLKPKHAVVLAYILAKKKDIGKAISILRKVKTSSSEEKLFVQFHKGLLTLMGGNSNGAMDILETIASENLDAVALLADISLSTGSNSNALKWLTQLAPTMYDNTGFLESLESIVSKENHHKHRLFQVRALFDPAVPIHPEPIPLLKNSAMAGESFRSLVGVKDPTGPAAQMWLAIRKGLELIFPPTDPELPNARPAKGTELLAWEEIEATLGQSGVIWIADLSNKPVLVIPGEDKPQIVVRPELFELPSTTIRFILGRALEAARSGYSLLFHLSSKQRREVFSVMYSLALPPSERDETAKQFLASLERRLQKAVERVSSSAWEIFPTLNLDNWLETVELALDKTGLLLAGDLLGAFKGSNYLHNRHTIQTDDPIANFALAPRSGKLIASYISPQWNEFYKTEDQ